MDRQLEKAWGRRKNMRVLSLYDALCQGQLIQKSQWASYFQVTTRSIQRDLDDIRAFLQLHQADCRANGTVMYDRHQKGYLLCWDGEDNGKVDGESVEV